MGWPGKGQGYGKGSNAKIALRAYGKITVRVRDLALLSSQSDHGKSGGFCHPLKGRILATVHGLKSTSAKFPDDGNSSNYREP